MSLPATNDLLNTTTLRPGLLVYVSVRMKGNVDYKRQEIEAEHFTATGELESAWETKKRISDPAEFEQATKAQSKARAVIAAVCSQTAFGLLCPEAKASDLAKAKVEADKIVAEFNRYAKNSRLILNYLTGRVAPDDVTAVTAINKEVRDLLVEMQEGIKTLDVKRVRDAATEARQLGAMLSDNAKLRIEEAIEGARKVAREINKAAKAGEQAALAIDNTVLRNLTDARTAFLDIDVPAVEAEAVAPAIEGRAVDLTTDEPPAQNAAPAKVRDLELS